MGRGRSRQRAKGHRQPAGHTGQPHAHDRPRGGRALPAARRRAGGQQAEPPLLRGHGRLARPSRLDTGGECAITPVTELLSELVRIDSVNPSLDPASRGEAEVAAFVARFMRGAGFHVEMPEDVPGRPSVVARVGTPTPDRPALLLECHVDTVPLGSMRNGLRPRVRDGRLFGRGACDVKGGLAAMMTALASRRDASKPLVFWATVDEEHDFGGVRALAERGIPALGAVVAEPTRLRPVIAHKGCLRVELQTRGRAAHSARPELGDNAVLHAMRLIDTLQRGFAQRFAGIAHPLCGPPLWSVTQIATTNPINVIPDACRLGVDVRVTPGQDADEILVWLDGALAAAGVPVEKQLLRLKDYALDTAPSAAVARWALEVSRAVLGEDVAPEGAPFGTDASKISVLAGVPAVVLGPGDITWAHTVEEHIALDELERGVAVYEGVIDRYLAEG